MNEEGREDPGSARRRRVGAAAFLAALALLVQNVAVFLAFLLVLGGDSRTAVSLAQAFFFVDVPALLVLGAGLALLAGRNRDRPSRGREEARGASPGRRHLLRLSGLLCVLSGLLSGAWRWGIPALIGTAFPEILLAILDSDGGIPAGLAAYGPHLRAMLLLWMGASAALATATYALRAASRGSTRPLLLEEKVDLRSWEGFATLNAAATFFVALEMLRILDGRPGGSLLLAGIFLKATIVPLNGAFAYGYLARRAWRLRGSGKPAPLAGEEALRELAGGGSAARGSEGSATSEGAGPAPRAHDGEEASEEENREG